MVLNMRSSIQKPEYFYMMAMKKKPRLKEYFDNIDNLSEDDINSLPESKWIRDSLLIIKKHGIKHEDDAHIVKRIMKNVKQDILGNPDELYFIREWTSKDCFMSCDTMFADNVLATDIDVSKGEPILISPIDRVIMFGSVRITLPASLWKWLIENTKCLGKMTRNEYLELYKEYVSKKL